jgi:hypothetical protein
MNGFDVAAKTYFFIGMATMLLSPTASTAHLVTFMTSTDMLQMLRFISEKCWWD